MEATLSAMSSKDTLVSVRKVISLPTHPASSLDERYFQSSKIVEIGGSINEEEYYSQMGIEENFGIERCFNRMRRQTDGKKMNHTM